MAATKKNIRKNATEPPQKPRPERWARLPEFLLILVLNVVLFFVLLADPFSDNASKLMIKLGGPTFANLMYEDDALIGYRFTSQPNERISNNKIVVMTIDDLDIQTRKASYPLNYAAYADDLQMLGQLGARAILIDLIITDERGPGSGIEQLVETVCDLARRIPVYIASTRNNGQLYDPTPLHPALRAVSNFNPNPTGKKPCLQEVAINLANTEVDTQGWYYPLGTLPNNARNGLQADQHWLPTAGTAIYNDLLAPPGRLIQAGNTDTMALIWGIRSADYNLQIEQFRARQDLKNLCQPYFLQAPSNNFQNLGRWLDNTHLPTCPYFAEMSPSIARNLYNNSENPQIQTLLDQVFLDSIVVYGINLIGVKDTVHSPLHGEIGGGHYHAMAIHNLSRFQTDYIQPYNFGIGSAALLVRGGPGQFELAMLIAAMLIALIMRRLFTSNDCLRPWLSGCWAKCCESSRGLRAVDRFLNPRTDPFLEFSPKLVRGYLFYLCHSGLLIVLKLLLIGALAGLYVVAASRLNPTDPFVLVGGASMISLLFTTGFIEDTYNRFRGNS